MNRSPISAVLILCLSFIFFVMAEDNEEFRHLQDQKAPIKQGAEQGGSETKISPKNEWPELVGLDAADAEKRIKEDRPGIHIQVVPPDHFVSMDFNMGRVRLYVDSSEKIAKLPRIG